MSTTPHPATDPGAERQAESSAALADSIRSFERRLAALEGRFGPDPPPPLGPNRGAGRPEGRGGRGGQTRAGRGGLEARTWRRFAVAAVALSVAWGLMGVAPFLAARWIPRVDLDRLGNFGQTFQIAESFFSALSVAGVAYALVLQARDQADARRQAARSRRQAAAAEARSAELALLASLVQARAALVRTSQDAHEEAQTTAAEPAAAGKDQAGAPTGPVQQMARIRRDQLAELLALVDYAEHVSGWADKKAAHRPTPLRDDVPDRPPLFRPPADPA